MLTFQYNLPLQQGASLDKTLRYSAGNPRVPVNLSACSAWLVIRRNDARKTELLRLTTENGGLQVGNGFLRIIISRAQSQKFVWDDATYTCHIQYPASTDFPDGFVQRFLEGSADVSLCND